MENEEDLKVLPDVVKNEEREMKLDRDFNLPSLPLPEFSRYVKDHLEKGDAWTVWGKIMEELAHYYDKHYPLRMNNSQDYQQVGMVMYSKYPCIARTGSNPWVSCYYVIRKE